MAGSAFACTGGGSTATGAAAPQFSYAGPLTWVIAGSVGGPFSNAVLDIELANQGSLPVSWSASLVPSFIQLDVHAGEIQPSDSSILHAQLDEALAQTLGAGDSIGALVLRNESAPQEDVAIDCLLSITRPVIRTELLPLADFDSSGPAGGPFQPPSAFYSLEDTGSTPVEWQAQAGEPWVVVTPASGGLTPSESKTVAFAIDEAATASLAPGPHSTYVDIVDAANNNTLHSREVALNVTQASTKDGWTVFTPSPDTRRIYVSSSTGNDNHDGLSEAQAKRSIGAARLLLRDGFPDWLLLKRGDSFDYAFGSWKLSGRSATERMLISAYGEGARPLLRTGTASGIWTAADTNPSHLAIVGIAFHAHTYTGGSENPRGINWTGGTQNLLIEDCLVRAYETNIVVQGYPQPRRHSHVTIRRNVIVDAFNVGDSHSQGFYGDRIDDLRIEENVFDGNGWNPAFPNSHPTMFRHSVYVQNGCTSVVFRGNIVAGTDGAQIRPGGIVTDNFVARCSVGLLAGIGDTPEPDGVQVTLARNVIIEGRSSDPGNAGIFGLRVSNIVGGTISENIVANCAAQLDARALWLCTLREPLPVLRNVELARNTFHDAGRIDVNGVASQLVGVTLVSNVVQSPPNQWQDGIATIQDRSLLESSHLTGSGNRWFLAGPPQSEWFKVGGSPTSLTAFLAGIGDTTSAAGPVSFREPDRGTGTYSRSLGKPATYEALMSECRKQSKGNWRPEYTAAAINAYIREGFAVAPTQGKKSQHEKEPR